MHTFLPQASSPLQLPEPDNGDRTTWVPKARGHRRARHDGKPVGLFVRQRRANHVVFVPDPDKLCHIVYGNGVRSSHLPKYLPAGADIVYSSTVWCGSNLHVLSPTEDLLDVLWFQQENFVPC